MVEIMSERCLKYSVTPEQDNIAQLNEPVEIEVDNVSIIFGAGAAKEVIAVDRATLNIRRGEFVCIVGPSGCGKSTLLNAIAGFEVPYEGTVRVGGRVVTGPGPDRGMVFQQPTLFPWKTVRSNVAYGPRMMGKGNAQAFRIADKLLEVVGLKQVAGAYPHVLSGGMRQRVAIARALANNPEVLLMDEPFGALDAQTREIMQENLLEVWSKIGATVLFITHDIDEAIFLADRILVMSASPGRILREVQVRLPRPRNTDMTLSPEFIALKKSCLDVIRAECLRAYELQKNNFK
jgi:NitT/TauT family transport system ATP-binding protein